MTTRASLLVVAGLAACACGGGVLVRAEGGSGGELPAGGAGAGGQPAGGGGGAAKGGEGGGTWTQCSSPGGDFMVCGGPYGCPLGPPECQLCDDPELAAQGEVTLCVTYALAEFGAPSSYLCPDGAVLLDGVPAEGLVQCVPYEIGVLFQQNGALARVHCADGGYWDGELLPAPLSCPSIAGVAICGGHCGGCAPGRVCTGRSRLHPYSLCVPDSVDSCELPDKPECEEGTGCFVFTVEPEAQELANRNGYCLPLDECHAAAKGLPGGGQCVLP